jgi:hypothetical protein
MRFPLQRLVMTSCALFFVLGIATPARAQERAVTTVEDVDFDRPESWAMKYFNSTTLFTGLEMPGQTRPRDIRIGIELASIPSLSEEQQIVGYSGTKPEDLNKAPMFVRPRVTFGLPQNFSLTIGGVPPVKAFGVTPRLLTIALGRSLLVGDGWNAGARMSVQLGSAKGAFTCPKDVLGFAPLSPQNPYGCRAESEDVAHLRYIGGEVSLWRTFTQHDLTPYASFALTHMDNVFNVNAHTRGALFEFHDQSELRATGNVFTVGGGLGFPLGDRIGVTVGASYTPLGVMRELGKTLSTAVSNEGLFNVKALFTYRVK